MNNTKELALRLLAEVSPGEAAYLADGRTITLAPDEVVKLVEAARAEPGALIREMRDALKNVRTYCPSDPDTSRDWSDVWEQMISSIAKADAFLGDTTESVKYGCHEDACTRPDCVLDYGRAQDCSIARLIYKKDQCENWRPIK